MKKRITRTIVFVLTFATILTAFAFAASEPAVTVRLNGSVTACKEGSPYVDDKGTVYLPLSFVNGLGANVTADTEKGGVAYVTAQTAEKALNAVVDYSDTAKTVGIWYGGKLSAEQITMLRTLPYTQPDHAVSYAQAKKTYKADRLAYCYGTDRESFGNFANAREHLYQTSRKGEYGFPALEKKLTDSDTDTFYKTVVEAAVKEVAYTSSRVTVEYLTDPSCIYQSDSTDRITCAVRGIARIKLAVEPKALTGSETAMLCRLGFTQLKKGVLLSVPVDVHMHTRTGYAVTTHSIKPAGEQF